MGKKKTRQPKHRYELTKHQLSRQQQQKRRRRIFLFVGIGVIATVAGVLGGGYYRNEYQPRQETVIRVNGTDFSMGYFLNQLKLQGEYYAEIYGADQASVFLQTLMPQVERYIEEGELVRQAAAEMGIVVSNQEVKQSLAESDPPLPAEYTEMMRSNLLVERLVDEHFSYYVPAKAPQRNIRAVFLEGEAQAEEVRGRLEAGEDFTLLAEEYSLIATSDFGWHVQGILTDKYGYPVVDDYAFLTVPGSLSQPLHDKERSKNNGYWLAEVVERSEDSTGELYQLRVMLLGSQAEAREMKDRLEAGDDFGALADEYSQYDTAGEGGDMGLLSLENIHGPLQGFVLEAEAGVLSEIIEDETAVTTGGYWLVEVVAAEDNRELSQEDRDFLEAIALDDWITALWEDPANEIESFLDDDRQSWAIARVLSS